MYRAKSRGKAGLRRLRRGDARRRGDPAAAGDRPAPGDKAWGIPALLPADRVATNRQKSEASRPSCAGTTPTAVWSARMTSSPLAEETKLILPIGLWVIRTAADQLRKWQEQFGMNPPLSMSVNLSCRQFLQPDLVYQVERRLLETGLDPRCLKMEITESAIMEQVESASSALVEAEIARASSSPWTISARAIHRSATSISSRLTRSRSTARSSPGIGPRGENTEIVRTIISLAKGLGLDVVAEGVETESQLFQLRDLGCQFGQGYFFSRPCQPKPPAPSRITAAVAGSLESRSSRARRSTQPTLSETALLTPSSGGC